jgi:hypothetical protein
MTEEKQKLATISKRDLLEMELKIEKLETNAAHLKILTDVFMLAITTLEMTREEIIEYTECYHFASAHFQ